ncbi:hypothetical protein MXD62_19895 [Frankia sp. Mgl5]|uniref:DUF6941 family protein n=1 Tax=Frankiaceae TaxID=74712 RepID=UPI00200C7F15|nr:hypothetical protein [Frankia sp. Mgl5]MCK9929414.1 hypothetical protein [Frankia sp. Mgl5]
MRLTMILCDAAQVSAGKLFILGGGWNIAGPGPFPSALAVLVEVPWDRSNTPFTLSLELLEEDGEPVIHQGPLGPQPVRVEAQMEVGRPPGIKKGSPLSVPFAVNVASMQLTPGSRYYWEAKIEGQPPDGDRTVSFQVRAN